MSRNDNNKNSRKNNDKILHPNANIENLININNKNRTLIVRVSNSGKSHLVNHILLRKQDPIFLNAQSLNQYPKLKAQTSDEIQPLNEYENSTVAFDVMLL